MGFFWQTLHFFFSTKEVWLGWFLNLFFRKRSCCHRGSFGTCFTLTLICSAFPWLSTIQAASVEAAELSVAPAAAPLEKYLQSKLSERSLLFRWKPWCEENVTFKPHRTALPQNRTKHREVIVVLNNRGSVQVLLFMSFHCQSFSANYINYSRSVQVLHGLAWSRRSIYKLGAVECQHVVCYTL